MAHLQHVTVATATPDELASFWAAALDGERRGLPDEIEPVIVETPDGGPDLLFKHIPCESRENLAIHLDLAVEDREAAEQRLCDLGASVRERKSETFGEQTDRWTVMEDPAGNGFCISEY